MILSKPTGRMICRYFGRPVWLWRTLFDQRVFMIKTCTETRNWSRKNRSTERKNQSSTVQQFLFYQTRQKSLDKNDRSSLCVLIHKQEPVGPESVVQWSSTSEHSYLFVLKLTSSVIFLYVFIHILFLERILHLWSCCIILLISSCKLVWSVSDKIWEICSKKLAKINHLAVKKEAVHEKEGGPDKVK